MRASVAIFAVLVAAASTASAQSVTLYGRVDLSVGKASGSADKYLDPGSSSRVGLRGIEDLGGGLQAIFNIEHQFESDTGAARARYWHGRSFVGLQGGFGQILLGRDFAPNYLQVQAPSDPWLHETVVNAAGGGNFAVIGLGLTNVRNDSSITYRLSKAGFTFGAQVAEATDAILSRESKPWSVAVNYDNGPLTAGIGLERNGLKAAKNAQVVTGTLYWDFGPLKVGGAISRGHDASGLDRTGWQVAAVAPVGGGQARLSYAKRKDDLATGKGVTTHAVMSAGYHYSLSRRTTLYGDLVHNSKAVADKTGYDFGLKHSS